MGTALDQIADVSFTRDTPVVQTDSYGVLMIVSSFLAAKTTVAFGRFRAYFDGPSMLADGWLTTDEVYILGKNAFAQEKPPDHIVVGRRDAADADWEVALTAINTASTAWYLLAIADAVTDSEADIIAPWVNANAKFWVVESTDADIVAAPYDAGNITDIGAKLKSLNFFNGRVVYNTVANRTAGQRLGVASMIAEAWRVPGSFTYKFKTPAGCTACGMTLAQKKNAWSRNVDTFNIVTSDDTEGIMENGTTPGGEWIDIIIFDRWLQAYLQGDIYSYLKQQPKAPLSDEGFTGLQGVIQARMELGADNGGLLKNTIKITMPKYADVSAADRQARKVNGIKVQANHLQAIHFVGVSGVLSA